MYFNETAGRQVIFHGFNGKKADVFFLRCMNGHIILQCFYKQNIIK